MRKKIKKICGVGINDADYPVQDCPFYNKWLRMYQRCYSESFLKRRPSYNGCGVLEDWKFFTDFKSWMEEQEWEGNCLDKDLLVPGNRMYGPDLCVFVSQKLNSFLIESNASRGKWPVGVDFHQNMQKFRAQCVDLDSGKRKHIGYYWTPEEAHQAWLDKKIEMAYALASQQSDPRVAAALIDRYENYAKYFRTGG